MGLLYGRAGRLTAVFGGFRPGQVYFGLTHPLTMARLRRASDSVKDGGASSNNEWLMAVPQLWLYSEDDRVCAQGSSSTPRLCPPSTNS
jgi:hypothetical protein